MKRCIMCLCLLFLNISILTAQNATISIDHILDEGEDFIIDRPQDAAVNSKGIIAIAELRQAKVLIFDQEGRFLRSIGQRGNGPGEMQMVYHIEMAGDYLWVLDTQLQRVSSFDVNTGNVLSTAPFNQVFGKSSPVNTTAFQADDKEWLGVVVTDLSAGPGANTTMKMVALDADLNVSEKNSFEFDIAEILKGREAYAMSFFRPASNYSFAITLDGMVLAPYHFDGTVFQHTALSGKFSETAISIDKKTLQNRVFSSSEDQEAYMGGRNMIVSAGSSPSGPQMFVTARHALHVYPHHEKHTAVLFAEYQYETDAYAARYSIVDAQSKSELRQGTADITRNGHQQQTLNLRRILSVNAKGKAVVQFLEEGEPRLAIAQISIR